MNKFNIGDTVILKAEIIDSTYDKCYRVLMQDDCLDGTFVYDMNILESMDISNEIKVLEKALDILRHTTVTRNGMIVPLSIDVDYALKQAEKEQENE